ncbi:MAG: mechanosensitive ion channel [Gammaproteobacteria bacterium]|nr:mechanosensitive ion channel [Gammaproteobacteria bacterium]
MPSTDPLYAVLLQFASLFTQPAGWIQMTIIVVAALSASLIHRTWGQRLQQAHKTYTGIRRTALGGSSRLLFPISFVIITALGRALLEGLGQHSELLKVVTSLILSLAIIRITVYLLRKGFPSSPSLKTWENSFATMIWVGVALHLLGWLAPMLEGLDSIAISTGENRISLLSVFKLITSVAFFMVLAIWLSTLLEKQLQNTHSLSGSMKVGLAKSVRMVLIILAFLIALDTIGIDLTALAVFGGALGVGLGFGLQRIASNFISGFILLFDRSIRPGDVISVGDSFGWVAALRARYVVVKDRDGVERLIPNENLITSEVINWSYSDRNVRLKLPVQISYNDDPEQAMMLMVQAANSHERVLKDPEAVARLMGFGDSGIDLELRLWMNDPEQGTGSVRSDINLAMWKTFKAHGITIPFPQRDVRLYQQ